MAKPIRLTHRQIDALYCLSHQNMTMREAADLMMVSEATIRDYAHQLRAIFGVKRTRDLVPHAYRWFTYGRLPQK